MFYKFLFAKLLTFKGRLGSVFLGDVSTLRKIFISNLEAAAAFIARQHAIFLLLRCLLSRIVGGSSCIAARFELLRRNV